MLSIQPKITDFGLWGKLPQIAAAKGYNKKIVGDYAWSTGASRVQRYIRLIRFKGNRDGKLQVYETGLGEYELTEAEVRQILENNEIFTSFLKASRFVNT